MKLASIQKRDGKYRVRVTRHGHPVYSKTFIRKVDAEKWSRQTEVAIESGTLSAPRPRAKTKEGKRQLSFCEIAEHYARQHSPHKRNARSEIGIIRILQKRWQSLRASEITKSEVLKLREYLCTLGRSGDTINHYLSAISKIYQTAAAELTEGLANPTTGVKRIPQGQGRIVRLSTEARLLLLRKCSESSERLLYPAVTMALETGMRRGELLSILWRDADLENRRVCIRETKNGETRTIPLTLKAKESLQAIKNSYQSEKIFPIGAESLRKHFERTVLKAARDWPNTRENPFLDLHFHDLRHEALSQFSDRGLNVIELAYISGHKTLRMLNRYTHPSHDSVLKKLDHSEIGAA